MAMTRQLKLGTRGSPLALFQANLVARLLRGAHPDLAVEICTVKTSGDRIQDRPLADVGGKGLFTKEIERGLLDDDLDIAVHSMKDMETFLPDGLDIVAVLPREDPRDAFLSRDGASLDDLPAGARIGTASVRRQAQILHRRPDLAVVPFRGNVETRLRKLGEGEADATLLAYAGLKRLEREDVITGVFDTDVMLPAAAQGAIGVEARADDTAVLDLLAALDDSTTSLCIAAERAVLAALDGSCRTPIGAFATLDAGSDTVSLQGLVARPDGSELHRLSDAAPAAEAVAMATELGNRLRAKMAPGFFE
jgi:hydroxymethylbilane synthase